tara:strand:+ start:87 stop:656 length:570 start_codon:yes stop_codon:yes gene_type:complete
MYIQTEITPNPATLKFLPGEKVLGEGNADFTNPEKAKASPLAKRIFETDGVDAVFLGPDFITVTKSKDHEWEHLKPGVLGSIMDHFQSGEPVLHENSTDEVAHAKHDGPNGEIVDKITELLDTRIRPAVAQDGGDITFHNYEDGVVYLHMQGACAGCPSSTMTLKMGIENLLRHYIPEVSEVRPIAENI